VHNTNLDANFRFSNNNIMTIVRGSNELCCGGAEAAENTRGHIGIGCNPFYPYFEQDGERKHLDIDQALKPLGQLFWESGLSFFAQSAYLDFVKSNKSYRQKMV
jgi:hypothetical protein